MPRYKKTPYKEKRPGITTFISPHIFHIMERLIEEGIYTSKAEITRNALTNFVESLNDCFFNDELIIPKIGDTREHHGMLQEYRDYGKYQRWCTVGVRE